MNVKVSIIVPVYNAQDFLATAIESVLDQSLQEFELILVDDGSKDQSGAICDAYAEKDSRIVVLHKENGGICDARNAGLRVATGQYVGFMDNDDILDTDTLKDNYMLAQAHGADWVKFGKKELLLRGGKILKERSTNFKEAVYTGNEILENLMQLRADDTMTFVWDSLIDRAILTENNLQFDTNFKSGNEDIDLCEQLAPLCKKLVVNPRCYYIHYTRLGVSASSKYSPEKLQSYLYLLEKCNRRYAAYGVDTPSNDAHYIRVFTRQIVVNVCQKLNDAGKQLSWKEKKACLQKFLYSSQFSRYRKISPKLLYPKSKKLFLYNYLFHNHCFTLLLLIDKLSRKLIYRIREIGAR